MSAVRDRGLRQTVDMGCRMGGCWESPWGWVVPFGASWDLGWRDGATGRQRSSFTARLGRDRRHQEQGRDGSDPALGADGAGETDFLSGTGRYARGDSD